MRLCCSAILCGSAVLALAPAPPPGSRRSPGGSAGASIVAPSGLLRVYSARMLVMGSTRVALHAGSQVAATETNASTAATDA